MARLTATAVATGERGANGEGLKGLADMTPWTRANALAAMGATAAAATLPRVAGADPAPLRAGMLPIADTAGFYAAQAQGYFTAENLAVTGERIQGGAAAIPALLGGSLDVVYANSISTAEAIDRGLDLRIILEGTPIGKTPPDPAALLKRKGDPVRTGKDLEGRVVGVNAIRDFQWMIIRAWVKATGGDPDKVQYIEIPLPAMNDSIKAKRIDTALVIDPFMTTGLADPALELLAWPMSRVFAGGATSFYVVSGQLAERRPADVRAFMRAFRQGANWCNANLGKDAFVDLVASYSGLKPEVVRQMRMIPVHADVVPSSLPITTAVMLETGLLSHNVDLSRNVFS